MFLLRCFHRIVFIVLVCLLIQPMHTGEALLLSSELSAQKEDSYRHVNAPNKGAMVSESKSWVPAFIKATASYVSAKASVLSKLLGESHKNELFLDSRNLASYDTEDFEDDIEDIATSDAPNIPEYLQLRLRKLQDHVWQGEISPYTYDQGIKNLEPHIPKAALSQVREEFEAKVKSIQSFTESNFQKDLSTSLEELPESSSGVAFEELLVYYQNLQNPFDYANTLAKCRQLVGKKDR